MRSGTPPVEDAFREKDVIGPRRVIRYDNLRLPAAIPIDSRAVLEQPLRLLFHTPDSWRHGHGDGRAQCHAGAGGGPACAFWHGPTAADAIHELDGAYGTRRPGHVLCGSATGRDPHYSTYTGNVTARFGCHGHGNLGWRV